MHRFVCAVMFAGISGISLSVAAGPLDIHKKADDCGRCSAMLLQQVGLSGDGKQLASGAASNPQARVWLTSRRTDYTVCDSDVGANACKFDVSVAEADGKCVATLDYCGICVAGTATKVVWKLTNPNYTFGSKRYPNDGVVIPNWRTHFPRLPDWWEHFADPVKVSSTEFTWKVSRETSSNTWGRPANDLRHGHDLVVSKLVDGQPSRQTCEVVDPPILNVVN